MRAGGSLQSIGNWQQTQAGYSGVAMGIQAAGQITTASIGYAMKMSALNHQDKMQNRAWEASVQAIQEQSHLVDDLKAINTNKISKATDFVETKKDLDVAEARLLEAEKTDKAMKKANKALVKKALSDRRKRFYGKTASI